MTYELILLDADGTLFDYDRAEKCAIEITFRDFGLDYSDSILARYRVVNDALWKELERGDITSADLRVERFRRLLAELREAAQDSSSAQASAQTPAIAPVPDAEALSLCYLHHLARGSHLIDGAEDICRYMAQRYNLAILTNGIAEVQRSRLAKSALHDIVPHIIISEEVGLSKPDPRIFEYAVKILGYPRRDTVLMVGDSLSSDIRGGINAGIDTCWYNPHGARCSGDFTPTYEIRTLHELRQLL
jgi:2-haloacid dehalogenase